MAATALLEDTADVEIRCICVNAELGISGWMVKRNGGC